jgi:hypothetical protein
LEYENLGSDDTIGRDVGLPLYGFMYKDEKYDNLSGTAVRSISFFYIAFISVEYLLIFKILTFLEMAW